MTAQIIDFAEAKAKRLCKQIIEAGKILDRQAAPDLYVWEPPDMTPAELTEFNRLVDQIEHEAGDK